MTVTAEIHYSQSVSFKVNADPDDPDFQEQVTKAFDRLAIDVSKAEWAGTDFVDEDGELLFDVG